MAYPPDILKAPVRKRKTVSLFARDKATGRIKPDGEPCSLEDGVEEHLEASTLVFDGDEYDSGDDMRASKASARQAGPWMLTDKRPKSSNVYAAHALKPTVVAGDVIAQQLRLALSRDQPPVFMPRDQPPVFMPTAARSLTSMNMKSSTNVWDLTKLKRRLLENLQEHGSKTSKSTSIGDWGNLPDEVLLHILQFLPRSTLCVAARVSKQWHRVSYDDSLWRRVDMADKRLGPGVLGSVVSRGCQVVRLTRAVIKEPVYASVELQQRPSSIRLLDLSMVTLTPAGLEHLLGTCQHLQKLSLEHCDVGDHVFSSLRANSNLQVLNLAMCRGLSLVAITIICSSFPKLQDLNLAWTNLQPSSLRHLVSSLSPGLLRLNLSGCKENLTDDDVYSLCQQCREMKELDLSDASLITARSVSSIVCILTKLEYLALSRCYSVESTSFPAFKAIRSLLALDVFGLLKKSDLLHLMDILATVKINEYLFSSIARPTTGIRRTSIWGERTRDQP